MTLPSSRETSSSKTHPSTRPSTHPSTHPNPFRALIRQNLIGFGHFGVVYLAVCPTHNPAAEGKQGKQRQYAVKYIEKTEKNTVSIAQERAMLLLAQKHRNVIPFLAYMEKKHTNGKTYAQFVTPYEEEGDLFEYLVRITNNKTRLEKDRDGLDRKSPLFFTRYCKRLII